VRCSDQQRCGETAGAWLPFWLSALDEISKNGVGRTGFEPVTSSVSSLKERGRVKRGFTGLLPVFPAVADMLNWPAGPVAWGRGLPCSPAAAGPGERTGGSRTGRSLAGEAGAVRRPGRSRLRADTRAAGDRRGVWLWWLRAPWAARVPAGAWLRSSLRVSPRLAAAGHGAGPRGQRDQSEGRPPRGAGPDTEAITRCPRPGLLTWSRAARRGCPVP
jgi:hypothetical protein